MQKGEVLAVIRSGEVADYEKQQKDAAQQVLTARRAMDATQDMYVSGIASEARYAPGKARTGRSRGGG